ncbi:MAG: hypothetical protein M3R70_00830 [Actinomycetota bacterium]|nr:hypothetical protein [Actinomycetota bacterium]
MKRLRGRRFSVVAAVGMAAAVTGVGLNALTANGGRISNGPLRLQHGLAEPQKPYVRGRRVHGAGGRASLDLTARVSGALMGPLSPVAIQSPNRRFVAYNSWDERRAVDPELSFSKQGIKEGDAIARPSVRVLDTANGRDELLAEGAYSVAWRRDGAVAYVEGLGRDFSAGREFLGRVVVRKGVHGPRVVWTPEAARYVVYGWAGRRLIVYRLSEGEHLDTFVLDLPGRARLLAPGTLVALSPDGARAFVVSSDGDAVRVLNVGDGSEVANLDLRTADPPLDWVAYSGSWAGDHVVASTSRGLAVFRMEKGEIVLEQVLGLAQGIVQEPRFTDDSARVIAAVAALGADAAATNAVIECDRVSRSCLAGDPAPARDWLRLLDNPSRENAGSR